MFMTNRIFTLVSLLFLTFQLVYSQDIIYKTDGTRIDSKILEIHQDEIWYKKWNYQDGPTISIGKYEILLIQYSNGDTEVFNTPQPKPQIADKQPIEQPSKFEYDYNSIIALNPLALINSNVAISYERFYKNGRHSFKIPIFYGYRYGTILTQPEIRTYSKGKKPVKYFIGPMARVGTIPRFNSSQTYIRNILLLGGLINNGIYVQAGKSFNLSLDLGVGLGWNDYNGINFQTNVGLSFGWRF
jgi:hypothetical protein